MSRLYAVGGGGHLRVLLEALRLQNQVVSGILDADPRTHGTTRFGIPILGGDDVILGQPPTGDVQLVNGLGSTRDTGQRRRVWAVFQERGYRFASVVHPAAVIAEGVELGEGAQVMAGVVLQPGTTVGDNSIINTGACVDHDCRVGSHVHVAPGAVLSGGVKVGDGAHLGTGCTVIQGIQIGASALVGAGAVVVSDVPAGAVVLGVPARERGR